MLTESEVYEIGLSLHNEYLAGDWKQSISRFNSLPSETRKQLVDLFSNTAVWPPKEQA